MGSNLISQWYIWKFSAKKLEPMFVISKFYTTFVDFVLFWGAVVIFFVHFQLFGHYQTFWWKCVLTPVSFLQATKAKSRKTSSKSKNESSDEDSGDEMSSDDEISFKNPVKRMSPGKKATAVSIKASHCIESIHFMHAHLFESRWENRFLSRLNFFFFQEDYVITLSVFMCMREPQKSFIIKSTAKIDVPIGHFMLPLLMLTSKV